MPRDVTGGTALNALAHACEALYVVGSRSGAPIRSRSRAPTRSPTRCRASSTISATAPPARRCSGAPLTAGEALGRSGLALAHAMAQAIGGRYGLPHGALNAICLPPGLRFNAEFVPAELLDGHAAERRRNSRVSRASRR